MLTHANIVKNAFYIGGVHEARARGQGVHTGTVLPLLRLRAGHPRHRHARGDDGSRSRASTPRRCCEAVDRSGARRCSACRRCSSPSWSTRTSSSYDTSSLRTGIMAGSPCPIEVMKKVVDVMGADEITIAYGQTESAPVITQTRTDDPLELRVSTVGRALPDVEVKIVERRDRRGAAARRAGRALHPRLPRHEAATTR